MEPNNPLTVRRSFASGSATLKDGTPVPTDLDAYCAWMNDHEWRRGEWTVTGERGSRKLDWKPELATDGWLAENGFGPPHCPSADKRRLIAEALQDEERRAQRREAERR